MPGAVALGLATAFLLTSCSSDFPALGKLAPVESGSAASPQTTENTPVPTKESSKQRPEGFPADAPLPDERWGSVHLFHNDDVQVKYFLEDSYGTGQELADAMVSNGMTLVLEKESGGGKVWNIEGTEWNAFLVAHEARNNNGTQILLYNVEFN